VAGQGVAVTGAWPTADDMALDGIKAEWGEIYDTGIAGGEYCAFHVTGGRLLTAATPEGLASAIRADWSRRRPELSRDALAGWDVR
jgi:hypothetical protein